MKCSIPVESLTILRIIEKFPNSHSTFEYQISIGTEMVFSSMLFCCLRPKSTAIVIAGRSVHLITLFPGQA